ncbi:hypothetical protein AB6A40_009506 [Gnathostoma spinigerum]|uniref:Uncharacterized protein n=1 Tax=Gnathostoma spinigerum TaxID=75299 RepID=A0ABD6EUK7_9BILA
MRQTISFLRLLYDTGIERIQEGDFDSYISLEEIVIEHSALLRSIDGDAFGKLRNLGKLSISGCERLKEVTGVLLVNNTKLLSLSLDHNGLVRMPNLWMTDQHRFVLEFIDFSYNHIEYLGDGQLRRVHANRLILSHNSFREIGSNVFANCMFSSV